MEDLLSKELNKITEADLSNYDSKTRTYYIPKRQDIKLEEDNSYLIHIKPTILSNESLKINWNAGSLPSCNYMIISVVKLMGKMLKVDGVQYDNESKNTLNYFWSGWLTKNDIEVIQKV